MTETPANPDGEAEEVGFRKPPVSTRFQKGNRANPHGRRGRVGDDFAESVRSTLAAKVEVREGRRRRLVSKNEANILSLFNKAKRGDARAADRLLTLHELSTKSGGAGSTVIEVHNALSDERGARRDLFISDGGPASASKRPGD